MGEYTPMMRKYLETKEEYRDCILFYRLGDFYEMFFDDAVTASRELELTLTGKDCGMEERAPMCGVPYHAVDNYLGKLVAKGYKVAICEQVEDPKLAKGLVKREVIRVVTPGTNLNTDLLDASKNNYLMAVIYASDRFGIAAADITTGAFFVTEAEDARKLLDEISRYEPAEIICNQAFELSGVDISHLKDDLRISVSSLDEWYFNDDMCERALRDHFHVAGMNGLGLDAYPCGMLAAGAVMQYLTGTQKSDLSNLTKITPYSTGRFMVLDTSTRRNLELCETLREKQKRGSLLWVLDHTKTAMGARMLRSFIEQPLLEKDLIDERLDAVEDLFEQEITREELREYLNPVYDLERLISRISYRTANPRDLNAFASSLEMVVPIKAILGDAKAPLLIRLRDELDELSDITSLIRSAIVDEPPMVIREGGFIREGFNEQVDRLRSSKTEGKTWLAELEAEERERTGIKNLRIRYNKVFGYYLEVTNSYKDLVPEDYMRKQTLTNAERYITPRLKELEDMILGAEDKLSSLEYALFTEVRDTIAENIVRIQQTATALAGLDVFASLAYTARHNNYVRPEIGRKGIIDIKNGRHPVVEKMIREDQFIPNDTFLDTGKNRVSVITGPNMAGKSTYMRQVALIVLMAQMGSFVPADKAKIGLADRIFTRVGASDDLASGQSTFMVEMTEVANILRSATRNSLLILDEIGRGTSTFDGLSIAWSVIEHVADPKLIGARTLFATHYHELTELEGKIDGVNNYCIAVKEQGDDIVFLRKIVRGGADKSYGIQVASLAGVPDSVIRRAKELLGQLTDADITERIGEIASDGKKKKPSRADGLDLDQISLFDAVRDEDVLKELEEMDISNMTPLDALNTLYRFQSRLKNRWSSSNEG